MGSGTRLKRTRQGPLTLGFNKVEKVFNPYIGTRGGLNKYGGVPRF